MFRIFLLGITLLLFALSHQSCKNPAEELPSYVYIDTIQLSTKAGEGSNSQQITEVWAYFGSEFVGAYDLPALFPILVGEEDELTIFPGIKQNGISNAREVYPFYTRYRVTKNWADLKIDTIQPIVEYQDDVEFVFVEDFELGNLFGYDVDQNSFSQMTLTTTEAFEGNRSGRIYMADSILHTEVGTTLNYNLPKNSEPVYIEMDYKNNVPFDIAVAGVVDNGLEIIERLTLTPKDDWNKIYFMITNNVISLSNNEYKIVIRVLRASKDDPAAEVLLDNIKLIHFTE